MLLLYSKPTHTRMYRTTIANFSPLHINNDGRLHVATPSKMSL